MPNNENIGTTNLIDTAVMDELNNVMASEQLNLNRIKNIASAGVVKHYGALKYKATTDPLLLELNIAMTERVQLTLKFGGEVITGEYEFGQTRTFKNIRQHSIVLESTVVPSHFIVIQTPLKNEYFNAVIERYFDKHNSQQYHLKNPSPLLYVLGEDQ